MASTPEVIKPAAEAAAAATPSHTSSLAGSVIEAKDGMGGSNFIRIQNMSATGKCCTVLLVLKMHRV